MPNSSELTLPRVSPLRDVAVQGRFGASRGQPGVTFTVRHPLSIVTVIARAGQGSATADVLRDYTAQWAGPDQYFVLAEGRGEFLPVKDPPKRFPLLTACRSKNLWMANGVQFFTNIGWAFLILSLPDYHKKVMHLDDGMTGLITTGALTIGIAALPLGGMLTDQISRKHGKRLGRMLPMSVTKFAAAGCYVLALYTDTAWGMAIMFGLVAFFADIGLPAMWTLMQDISGKHQAQLFGWGNMWGNFGAAIQPVMFTAVLKAFDTNHDFYEGVWLCAVAFVLAGVFALFVNAEKPVTPVEA